MRTSEADKLKIQV